MSLTIGSLFSGIGGFELAGEWMGHRTIWQSEIDPYCVALLAERFPDAKQLGDISLIDWSQVERPTILTGGFPCQDTSYAGLRAGLDGKQSGLWYEYARAIRELGPRYVIVENVPGLLTRGFDAVLGTLADLGYDAEWTMLSACAVGAPHTRNRVWIIAYPQRDEQPRTEPRHGAAGRVGRIEQPVSWDRDWEGALREFRGMDDGLSYGVDRLDGLRNAIVPACALPIFQRLAELDALT